MYKIEITNDFEKLLHEEFFKTLKKAKKRYNCIIHDQNFIKKYKYNKIQIYKIITDDYYKPIYNIQRILTQQERADLDFLENVPKYH